MAFFSAYNTGTANLAAGAPSLGMGLTVPQSSLGLLGMGADLAPSFGLVNPVANSQFIGGFDNAIPAGAAAGADSSGGSSGLGGALTGLNVGLSIASAIGSIYSAWNAGKTANYVADKQIQILKDQQAIAQLNAEQAYRQGEAQAAQLTMKYGAQKAQQKVALAANGVRMNFGSGAEMQASTDIMKEIDRQNIAMNALASAWGYKTNAAQAGMSMASARAKAASANDWGDTLLTGGLGAMRVARTWYGLSEGKGGSFMGFSFGDS